MFLLVHPALPAVALELRDPEPFAPADHCCSATAGDGAPRDGGSPGEDPEDMSIARLILNHSS